MRDNSEVDGLGSKDGAKGTLVGLEYVVKRNNYVFEGKSSPLEVVAQRVSRQSEDHDLYSKQIYLGNKVVVKCSPNQWIAPPASIVR